MAEITVVTPPTEEPVSLALLKVAIGISIDSHDELLQILLQSAREWCETYTRSTFCTTTYRMAVREWCNHRIELWKPPLVSVTGVTYGPENSVLTSDQYHVDVPSSTITLMHNTQHGFKVTYVAGYGDANSVPAGIKQAVMLLVKHAYFNQLSINEDLKAIPDRIESLLSPYVLRYSA